MKLTAEPLTKLVPVTVSENAAEPARTLAGWRLVIVGGFVAGAVMVKFTAAEVPPPDGFVTVTGTVAAMATAEAGIAAVSCVALTKVVVTAVPLKLTVEPLTKFLPVTASENAAEPATTLDGCSAVTTGGVVPGGVIVKLAAGEVPPPDGFVTVTGTVPAVTTAAAGMAALSSVPPS